MVIKRFLDKENLDRMKNDFDFLFNMMNDEEFKGEFDLALRDNYFNLYYKGNSLARVDFSKDNKYKIEINNKFFDKTSAQNDKRFHALKKNDYFEIVLEKKLLHPFFQKEYIDQFISNIRKVNYSEELILEQAIITDNLEREDFIIIDRQIMDKSFKKRMDLLVLKQVKGNTYSFLVIEVKMGNNPELKDKVAEQLEGYVSHIDKNFNDYKECYEEQYKQKREIGLINIPEYEKIDIIKPVDGMIVVAGYSGIAKIKLEQLRKNYQNLDIRTMDYHIDINKKIPEEVKQAMKDLNFKFMTMEDYYQAIEAGELVKKPGFVDDMRFYSEHPEHPLAGDNRFKRIKAADQIRDYSKKERGGLPQDVLDVLHVSLFDCCAAVRHSVAQALFYAGDDSSLPFLERLINTEKESKVVKKVAEIALLKLKHEIPFPAQNEDIIHFASDNIDLAIGLYDFCQKNNKKLFFPDPSSPDIIAVGCLALIVDRHFIDQSVWESFCEYCKEGEDDTPVIIVDANLEKSLEQYPLRPEHDNVFLIEQWFTDAIKEKLASLI